MNALSAPGSGTAHQRQYARILMTQLELSVDRFTCQHRVPFRAAGLQEPPLDADVDAHLRSLSKAQMSHLIRALKEQTGEEDDD